MIGILLENDNRLTLEVTIRFEFPTTNNQVGYEVWLVRLYMDFHMGVKEVTIRFVVTYQSKWEY